MEQTLPANVTYILSYWWPLTLKRQSELLCDVNDLGNRIHTDWLLEPNANINQDINRNVRRDAVTAVSQWTLGGIAGSRQAGTLTLFV